MRIAIYGLGYVGLTAAVCLAKQGHQILGVDINEDKVNQINAGGSPIDEPGVAELLRETLGSGALRCATHASDSIDACDMAIVCVGTPSGLDGAHNMSFVAEVSRQIARAVDRNRSRPLTVVYRSTARPGTVDQLIQPIFQAARGDGGGYELVCNPEFLRESTAIADFLKPSRIVVGTADRLPNARMDELHRGMRAPMFYTGYREAEMAKFADNAFHAAKVVFANELGRIGQGLGVNVEEVHRIFVSDTNLNISARYLRPGGAFGGSCLPKDVRALQRMSREIGAEAHVIDALLRSNEAHKHYILQRCERDLGEGARVLLLGLAFKSGSDDLRESPNIDLARGLIERGYDLKVYDPHLRPEALRGQNLGYAYSHLPTINDLLVSRAEAEQGRYDLVIDANDFAREMDLYSNRVISIASMQ